MDEFVLDGIDDEVLERLRERAERNGRDLEEEVLEILNAAVAEEELDAPGLDVTPD